MSAPVCEKCDGPLESFAEKIDGMCNTCWEREGKKQTRTDDRND